MLPKLFVVHSFVRSSCLFFGVVVLHFVFIQHHLWVIFVALCVVFIVVIGSACLSIAAQFCGLHNDSVKAALPWSFMVVNCH